MGVHIASIIRGLSIAVQLGAIHAIHIELLLLVLSCFDLPDFLSKVPYFRRWLCIAVRIFQLTAAFPPPYGYYNFAIQSPTSRKLPWWCNTPKHRTQTRLNSRFWDPPETGRSRWVLPTNTVSPQDGMGQLGPCYFFQVRGNILTLWTSRKLGTASSAASKAEYKCSGPRPPRMLCFVWEKMLAMHWHTPL